MEQEEVTSLMVTQPNEALSQTIKSGNRTPRRTSLPFSTDGSDTSHTSTAPLVHVPVIHDGGDLNANKPVYPYQSLQLVSDDKKAKIFGMHSVIQATIGQIQDKTQQILQDQERDLLRAFRSRLSMVQTEQERERRKNENGSAEWVLRCHKLTEELEWLRELTDKLTNENTLFIKENKKYARQLASHEQDRGFLLKQLVTARKESARLRQLLETHLPGEQFAQLGLKPETEQYDILEKSQQTSQALSAQRNRVVSRVGTTRGTPEVSVSRASTTRTFGDDAKIADFPSVITSVIDNGKKDATHLDLQLDESKKTIKRQKDRLSMLESQITKEKKGENELMTFFRQAVDDVRVDIAARRQSKVRALYGRGALNEGFYPVSSNTPPLDPRLIPVEEFGPRERVHVMEWLQTQDHVVKFLFDKLFPQRNETMQAKPTSHTLLELAEAVVPRAKTASVQASQPGVMRPKIQGFSMTVQPKYFQKNHKAPQMQQKSEQVRLEEQMEKDFMQF